MVGAMTWAGITNSSATPQSFRFPLDSSFLMVIVPSGFAVTIEDMSLE